MTEKDLSFFDIIKRRLLWLVLGLATSLILSKYIHHFEEILREHVLIVAFIPLVVYLADAIGTQMESIIVRSFVQERRFKLHPFLIRQFLLVLVLGTLLSITGYLGSYFIYHDNLVSLGLCITIFITALSSLLTGTIIPYMFWKIHEDPAEASGPIATVIQDTLSVLVYFMVFSLILG